MGLALNAQGCVAALRGRLDDGIPLLREALAIAREGQDPQDLGAAYVNLSHLLGMAGLLGDAVELARVGIGELTRVGQERQQGSLLLHNVSEQLVEAGRYAEARELVDEALARHPRGIQAAPVLRTAARIAMTSGDLTTAWERCEQARLVVEVESAPVAWLREVLETAAEVELWAGRPEAAYDVVLDGLELVAGTDDEAFATALVALGLRALADSAAVHRDHRARTLRESQRRRLLAALESMRRHPVAGGQPDDAALDLWVRAELARLDAPRDVAATAEAWARSADAWADLGRPFRSAYARWREAEARLAGGVNADSLGRAAGARTRLRSRSTRRGWSRRPSRSPRGTASTCCPPSSNGPRVTRWPPTTSPSGSARCCWRWPPGTATGRSPRRCSSASRRPRSTSPTSCASSTSRAGRTPPGSRIGWASAPEHRTAPVHASSAELAAGSEVASSCPGSRHGSYLPACVGATRTGEEVGPMDVAVLAGSVSTALFVGSYLPMLVKAFRTKDLDSYSRGNLVLATIGNAVYSVYVFSLPLGPIWFLHSFYVIATLLMLVWHVRHAAPPTRRPAPGGRGRPGRRRPRSRARSESSLVPI